jgi:hypothetical protein
VAGFEGSASMNSPVGDVHSKHMLLMGCQASMPGAAQGSVNSGWMADLQDGGRATKAKQVDDWGLEVRRGSIATAASIPAMLCA